MSIFNSLGSNYGFFDAWRTFLAVGTPARRQRFIDFLSSRYGGEVTLTYKGREAIALALNKITKPGSTVIINGFTCYAVYQAIVNSGYRAELLDIEPGSLNFSLDALKTAVEANPDITVVIIQNTLGEPCEAREIAEFCRSKQLVLIEDLAHSIGVQYTSGEEAGTIGDFTILSFSQDKVIDAVSGGALITRSKQYSDKTHAPAKQISRSQQLRDRFYPTLTYKIRLTHALGIGKLLHKVCRSLHLLSKPLPPGMTVEAHELPSWYTVQAMHEYTVLPKMITHRKMITEIYQSGLSKDLLMLAANHNDAIYLRFPILVKQREGLITYLRKRRIYISDIWYDAPIAPKKYMYLTDYTGTCPQSEFVSEQILNLPTHRSISKADAERIVREVNAWFATQHEV